MVNPLLLYTVSNSYVLLFQIIFQFLMLSKLDYTDYGIYSSAQLFSSYIVFFTFGLQTNLAVKISKNGGRFLSKDEVSSTWTFFLIIIILGVFFASFYDFIKLNYVRIEYVLILFFATLKAILIQKFLFVILRSSDQIRSLSFVQFVVSSILFLSIWIIGDLNLFRISFLLGLECTLYVFLLMIKSDIEIKLSFRRIKDVLIDGFQFWKVNLLFLLFPIIVSSIALNDLGIVDFGRFSIFFVVINMFTKFTQGLEKLNYIEISENSSNLVNVSPLKIFSKNIIYFLVIGLAGLVFFTFFGRVFLQYFMPNRITDYPIFLLAILMSILSLFSYLNVYYDVTLKFSLKYIAISAKIATFIMFYGILNFLELIDLFVLCELIILCEIISIFVNAYILCKTKFFSMKNSPDS